MLENGQVCAAIASANVEFRGELVFLKLLLQGRHSMLTRRAFGAAVAAAAGASRLSSMLGLRPSGFEVVRYRDVRGYRMAYREVGQGKDTFLFLHGNPTSSYLWRKVAPPLADLGRCIAPDLLGMGHSAKARAGDAPAYGVVRQRDQLDAFLDDLQLGNRVTLVVHDWGSIFGFDWARRHADRVRGIAHMEAFVEPVTTAGTPEAVVNWFRGYRTEAGAASVLESNQFVEQVLFRSVTGLTAVDSAVYRAPFLTAGDSRLPTLVFPRQVPIDGEPADVHALMSAAWDWMAKSPLPKLFIDAEPGAMVVARRKTIARGWPNTATHQVKARHFVPEDAPSEVAAAIRDWSKAL
jgi:haloalkane dehalogenase